uniref:Uncharacterized protein n=1 Tax=Ananas comosus var. bracteatus TaxID=296719 RepID=A0A6V7PVY4_ANACO|nr:unnamed protein product [Ananas comosus var. bracteatus]
MAISGVPACRERPSQACANEHNGKRARGPVSAARDRLPRRLRSTVHRGTGLSLQGPVPESKNSQDSAKTLEIELLGRNTIYGLPPSVEKFGVHIKHSSLAICKCPVCYIKRVAYRYAVMAVPVLSRPATTRLFGRGPGAADIAEWTGFSLYYGQSLPCTFKASQSKQVQRFQPGTDINQTDCKRRVSYNINTS